MTPGCQLLCCITQKLGQGQKSLPWRSVLISLAGILNNWKIVVKLLNALYVTSKYGVPTPASEVVVDIVCQFISLTCACVLPQGSAVFDWKHTWTLSSIPYYRISRTPQIFSDRQQWSSRQRSIHHPNFAWQKRRPKEQKPAGGRKETKRSQQDLGFTVGTRKTRKKRMKQWEPRLISQRVHTPKPCIFWDAFINQKRRSIPGPIVADKVPSRFAVSFLLGFRLTLGIKFSSNSSSSSGSLCKMFDEWPKCVIQNYPP